MSLPGRVSDELPPLVVADLGRMEYGACWNLQKSLWADRYEERRGDMLLLTEHDHVYTIGKGGDENHLLADAPELLTSGAKMFRIDRGGDVTYHGPGQIVGYPILHLSSYHEDIHWYLRNLEEVLMNVCKAYGIAPRREDGMTGVWVGDEKIAAIGVKVSRWVTMHGFALNVNTDLSRFDRIIPCGIFHKGVTSMEKVLGRAVDLEEVKKETIRACAGVFGVRPVLVDRAEVLQHERQPGVVA